MKPCDETTFVRTALNRTVNDVIKLITMETHDLTRDMQSGSVEPLSDLQTVRVSNSIVVYFGSWNVS